jgi:hypothetical protein
MRGRTAKHQSGRTEDDQEVITESIVREVSQRAVDHAPCITFGQVRELAAKQGMTVRDLVAQFQEDVERPREVFMRVWDRRLDAVVMPYRAVIAWYQQAIAPMLAQEEEPACACGCGAMVRRRKKWASPGCRQRAYRRSRTSENPSVAA